ncbi:MAG: nucleotidyltransferase domain-containing protein [Blastocatellia bacterium]
MKDGWIMGADGNKSEPDNGLSPDLQALIWMAKLASDNEAASVVAPEIERLAKLGESVDLFWWNLSKCAARHGMTPFLNQLLKSIHIESAPREVRSATQESASAIIQYNLLATAGLVRILSDFEKEGIFVIPIKGPALAWLLYRDISLREFSDLDLLIDRGDISKASRILAAAGYGAELELSPSQVKIFVKTENVLLFTHSASGRLVELHWELLPRYLAPPVDIQVFRERLTTVEPGGKEMKTFSREDMLIYLCGHGSKHHWEQVNWIVDVAALVNRAPEMDWDYVFEQAERQRSERMLLLGLLIAREALGSRLPEKALDLLMRTPIISRLAEDVRGWLLLNPESSPGLLKRWIFYWRLRKRLSDKLKFAFLSIAAPNTVDWQYVDLPESLSSLYLFARPLRLFAGLARRQ